ncbi:putative GST-like protein YibF [Pseudovibrio axinellae]|uniref:Putative GST-like protein YibF n=1 Tax=Pseudovibrio axinellae TaxID=989403 RepID=A0A166AV45_9HYPH|nr:glutathione S-transferase family protein [Pseudovibrio axinellae]KZL21590.1 putative GST-like protein YibF [Pseudovibrio axinellae]SER10790.1 Glutathione S-transferase [Pseudovibrio axinellae]
MQILRSSSASPFGRKIKIALYVLGLADKVEVKEAKTLDPNDTLRKQNPLGKIPCLILEDDNVLYDSRVITEYLDYLAGGEKLIPAGAERFEILTKQALADGICDAAIQIVYESRMRPENKQHSEWVEYQQSKVDRALASFESKPLPPVQHNSPDAAQIALACALGYLDLRFAGAWRKSYPKLVAWLDDFASSIPAFDKTKPELVA